MPATLTYQRPPLAAYQREFLDCPARYTVIQAATKTGKTTACLIWLIEQALRGSNGQAYWWAAPVHNQAKIAYRRAHRMLGDAARAVEKAGGKFEWKANDSSKTITLPNGAYIAFLSAEKPDNLYGEDVYAAVVDEATRCRSDSWDALRTTLTATGGPAKIIGNVKGRRNWVHRMAQNADGQRIAYFQINAYQSAEAGYITYEEIEDARASLPEHAFKELYLAEPAEDGANPFGEQYINAAFRRTETPGAPVYFGIDVAKSQDWTVVTGLDAAGRLAYFDRFQLSWEHQFERIRTAVGQAFALIDSTGSGDNITERLERALPGIQGFKFTSTSKQQLMESLAVALQNDEIHLGGLAGADRLREELLQFEYAIGPGGRPRYSAPFGFHDDCVCALALAVRSKVQTASRAGGLYFG